MSAAKCAFCGCSVFGKAGEFYCCQGCKARPYRNDAQRALVRLMSSAEARCDARVAWLRPRKLQLDPRA